MITVYGASVSPFVRKVLVAVQEKGLGYEHVPVLPHDKSDAFKAASPLGKIPGFRDGDFAIADSTAILTYLDRRYPQPALIPEGAEDAARAIWFEEFADTVLIKPVGTYVFQTVLQPRLFNKPTDQAVADAAVNVELPPMLDYLEGQVNEAHLVAARCTIADISVASVFATLAVAGHKPDASRWPKVTRYLAGIHGRPSFKVCAEMDRKMMAA